MMNVVDEMIRDWSVNMSDEVVMKCAGVRNRPVVLPSVFDKDDLNYLGREAESLLEASNELYYEMSVWNRVIAGHYGDVVDGGRAVEIVRYKGRLLDEAVCLDQQGRETGELHDRAKGISSWFRGKTICH
jgi:hypothetical protein